MATTGHEQEIIDVAGLKASLKKGGNKAVYNEAICSTAGATAAKVTNTTPPSFSLVSGATIIVKFTYAISVANATLKVGDADAKPIYYRGAALEANKVKAGDKVLLRYDGTSFNIIGSLGETYENKQAASGGTDVSLVTTGEKYAWNQKQDAITFNTAYNASTNKAATMSDITKANVGLGNVGNFKAVSTEASQGLSSTEQANARANIGLDNLSRLGCGYGTCDTDATTAAKTVSISHFLLLVNGIVSVRFTKAVSVDNATLNVSGSGAKPIFINGAALQKGLIKAGMTATFQYDGTNWNIISMMGLEQSTTPSDLYVDMGLPSGTLWAKANIDVTTQSGFAEVDGKPSPFKYECSFFSWGNVDGHNPISDSAFDYDWGSSNDGPYAQTQGAALTADAGLSFDAARANLGSPWRDPSTDDFAELFNNIDFVQADGETVIGASQANKLVTVNDIVGIYLKSKINGKLLFFACNGNGYGKWWYYRGSGGNCWSRSLNSQTEGRNLSFSSYGVKPQDNSLRYYSFSRRAVQ